MKRNMMIAARCCLFVCIGLLVGTGQLFAREQPVLPAPASFVMDAAAAADGSLWLASEGDGVWRYRVDDGWRHMDGLPGFPDASRNAYAVAEDSRGRIWIGTGDRGVAVWNGKTWKAYGPLEGLAGERVFDIACGHGLVAIATSGGLSLYNEADDTWRRITREDGLIEDQIASLAFAPGGDLCVAYQCGGVGRGNAASGYRQWSNEQAPWYWDKNQFQRQPKELFGRGLPSNLCNALAMSKDGVQWLATCSGLARKPEGSATWSFLRGADAPAKNRGLFTGVAVAPPRPGKQIGLGAGKPAAKVNNTRKSKAAAQVELLADDFVTALHPCAEGIWVGFRMKGAMLLSSRSFRILKKWARGTSKYDFCWVTSFVRGPGGELYAATYGKGLMLVDKAAVEKSERKAADQAPAVSVPFPKPEPAPSDAELERMAKTLAQRAGTPQPYRACFWREDWATRGDWCGRYGRGLAMLCAANAPYEDVYDVPGGTFGHPISVVGEQGPHRYEGDDLRHWVHWVNEPGNRNVLYCPESTTRTEAEWDDQGEVYPMAFDGPDVWALVRLPAGNWAFSFYFFNPNGHEKANALRDYLVEVRSYQSKLPLPVLFQYRRPEEDKLPPTCRRDNLTAVLKEPVLARTRVKDFAGGGVYKTFVFQGPGIFYVRVCRNYSMNTILNGVFANSMRFEERRAATCLFGPKYPNPPETSGIDAASIPPAPLKLWSAAQAPALSDNRRGIRLIPEARRLAYRALTARDSQHPIAAVWRWFLYDWRPEDRALFDRQMLENWDSKQEMYPNYRSREWAEFGPGTIPFSVREIREMMRLKINWRQYRSDYPGQPDIPVDELKRRLKRAK